MPPEKPIDAITADELSLYKDAFVLNDRVLLFFDFLRRRMGEAGFDAFCRDLCGRGTLDSASVRAIIAAHFPGSASEIEAWLSTTDYPEWMRLDAAAR